MRRRFLLLLCLRPRRRGRRRRRLLLFLEVDHDRRSRHVRRPGRRARGLGRGCLRLDVLVAARERLRLLVLGVRLVVAGRRARRRALGLPVAVLRLHPDALGVRLREHVRDERVVLQLVQGERLAADGAPPVLAVVAPPHVFLLRVQGVAGGVLLEIRALAALRETRGAQRRAQKSHQVETLDVLAVRPFARRGHALRRHRILKRHDALVHGEGRVGESRVTRVDELGAGAHLDLRHREVVGVGLDVLDDVRDAVRAVRVVHVRVQGREVRGLGRADGLEVAAVVRVQRGGKINLRRGLGVARQVGAEMLHEAPMDRLAARARARARRARRDRRGSRGAGDDGRHRGRARGEIRARGRRGCGFRGIERRRCGHPGELRFTHGRLPGTRSRRQRRCHTRRDSGDDTSRASAGSAEDLSRTRV